jgi:ABC-2 type transport system ATP-binding protein
VLDKGRKAFDGDVDEGIRFLRYDEDDEENSLESEAEMDEEMGADI